MDNRFRFFQRGMHDQAIAITESFHLLRRDQDHFHFPVQIGQAAINPADHLVVVVLATLDDQEVQVAGRAQLTAGSGAEENDPVRIGSKTLIPA